MLASFSSRSRLHEIHEVSGESQQHAFGVYFNYTARNGLSSVQGVGSGL